MARTAAQSALKAIGSPRGGPKRQVDHRKPGNGFLARGHCHKARPEDADAGVVTAETMSPSGLKLALREGFT